jgi:hypothetical protein
MGIVAIDVMPDEEKIVCICHLSAFESRSGNGSFILIELCNQADKFNVILKVSPIVMQNFKDPSMAADQLIPCYKSLGFIVSSGLLRNPLTIER